MSRCVLISSSQTPYQHGVRSQNLNPQRSVASPRGASVSIISCHSNSWCHIPTVDVIFSHIPTIDAYFQLLMHFQSQFQHLMHLPNVEAILNHHSNNWCHVPIVDAISYHLLHNIPAVDAPVPTVDAIVLLLLCYIPTSWCTFQLLMPFLLCNIPAIDAPVPTVDATFWLLLKLLFC